MTLRKDEYIGGVHFYIIAANGAYEIKEDLAPELDSETVYRGSYTTCCEKLEQMRKEDCVTW